MNILILMLDLDGMKTFDAERLRGCLSSLQGTRNWAENVGHAEFECEYDFDEDSTLIRLGMEHYDVAIWGIGSASLKAALEIQRCCGEDIHLLSLSPRLHLVLSGISTVEELRARIRASIRACNEGQTGAG